ncbi:hypothetical protein PtA15_10A339 [Puccinia triticina]|uniref:Uncharacterized protein n=1 Tax=Puccinia triticina TaxID=208348 RepID=A0ABY7CXR6_9BASI|nr:uncharacterized protein PtA15_10A339 [Puccinia triticina]WAQ88916.1 hypothetical protein PtA15_10A339 [Puccinia triticina]
MDPYPKTRTSRRSPLEYPALGPTSPEVTYDANSKPREQAVELHLNPRGKFNPIINHATIDFHDIFHVEPPANHTLRTRTTSADQRLHVNTATQLTFAPWATTSSNLAIDVTPRSRLRFSTTLTWHIVPHPVILTGSGIAVALV